jgi:RNA polymerase sigma-70 factor (ECF subfamily)
MASENAARNEPRDTAGVVQPVTLVDRLFARDSGAWSAFVRVYGPVVYHWCRVWQLTPDQAAAAALQTFRVIASELATFRNRETSETVRDWLWRRAWSHIEAQAAPDHEASLESSDALPLRPSSLPEDHGLLPRLLGHIREDFEERTWQAFWRTCIENHSPTDVAAQLDVSRDAVRVARARVLRRLREELSAWGDTSGASLGARALL